MKIQAFPWKNMFGFPHRQIELENSPRASTPRKSQRMNDDFATFTPEIKVKISPISIRTNFVDYDSDGIFQFMEHAIC